MKDLIEEVNGSVLWVLARAAVVAGMQARVAETLDGVVAVYGGPSPVVIYYNEESNTWKAWQDDAPKYSKSGATPQEALRELHAPCADLWAHALDAINAHDAGARETPAVLYPDPPVSSERSAAAVAAPRNPQPDDGAGFRVGPTQLFPSIAPKPRACPDDGATPSETPTYYRAPRGTTTAAEVIDTWELDYWLGSVVAHVLRAGRKPGETRLDALRNAAGCLAHAIRVEGGKE